MSIILLNLQKIPRSKANKIALSQYLDEKCRWCGGKFETLEELDEAVWAGDGIGHLECYEERKEP